MANIPNSEAPIASVAVNIFESIIKTQKSYTQYQGDGIFRIWCILVRKHTKAKVAIYWACQIAVSVVNEAAVRPATVSIPR